jgi:hypothetical protein
MKPLKQSVNTHLKEKQREQVKGGLVNYLPSNFKYTTQKQFSISAVISTQRAKESL